MSETTEDKSNDAVAGQNDPLVMCDFRQPDIGSPGIFIAYVGECSFIFQLPDNDGRYATKVPALIIESIDYGDVFVDVIGIGDAIARANEFIRDREIESI